MADSNKNDVIDIGKLIKELWNRRKTFYKVLPVVFILSCIYIVSLPRYYRSEVKLAPETENGLEQSGLGSLASSFGFDIGSMATSDAIFPELYPELLGTNDFVTQLFTVTVENEDSTIKTDYYTYLTKHQKRPWWGGLLDPIRKLFAKREEPARQNASQTFNPLHLTKRQSEVADIIKSKLSCSIDRKTSLITIQVMDQDPRICATIADSVRLKIQEFIIDYRTKKARIDVDYYTKLTDEAKAEYEQARQAYARFADSHMNTVLQSVASRQDDLEAEMQLKNNNYTAYNTQLQAAIAKLQQRTPSFTLLQGASIPVKPAGPKRMIFVLMMLILAGVITSARIIIKGRRSESHPSSLENDQIATELDEVRDRKADEI